MDNKTNAQITNQANKAAVNSLEVAVADVVSSGKATRKTKVTDADYHEYPNKNLVMKAMNGKDVIFSDRNGKIFQVKKKI